jgi:hypothetical protein
MNAQTQQLRRRGPRAGTLEAAARTAPPPSQMRQPLGTAVIAHPHPWFRRHHGQQGGADRGPGLSSRPGLAGAAHSIFGAWALSRPAVYDEGRGELEDLLCRGCRPMPRLGGPLALAGLFVWRLDSGRFGGCSGCRAQRRLDHLVLAGRRQAVSRAEPCAADTDGPAHSLVHGEAG